MIRSLNDFADQMPVTYTHVERKPGTTLVTLSCGHVSRRNQIYTYTVGHATHCFDCDQHAEALRYDSNPDLWSHITGLPRQETES